MERADIAELFYNALIGCNDAEQLFRFPSSGVEWICPWSSLVSGLSGLVYKSVAENLSSLLRNVQGCASGNTLEPASRRITLPSPCLVIGRAGSINGNLGPPVRHQQKKCADS